MEELVKYLRALVFLQVQQMSGEDAFQKPELLLSRAGFTAREVAEIMGKNQAAVAKAIVRAKKAARTALTEPPANPSEQQPSV